MATIPFASVAIATNTYYPNWYKGDLKKIADTDKIRGDLALLFFQFAAEQGIATVVIDGESSQAFREALAKIKPLHISFDKMQKRSVARRKAISMCAGFSGIEVIVLTEAEKVSFIKDCLIHSVAPILQNNADIVIPKRDDKLFRDSYPTFQYESEQEANFLIQNLFVSHDMISPNVAWDTIFGPRVFRNDEKTIACFMQQYESLLHANELGLAIPKEYFDPEEIAGTMFFPFILAHQKKLSIYSVNVPFLYPRLQKENEEHLNMEVFLQKRRDQRIGLLVQLMHFIGFLEGYKQSKIKILK